MYPKRPRTQSNNLLLLRLDRPQVAEFQFHQQTQKHAPLDLAVKDDLSCNHPVLGVFHATLWVEQLLTTHKVRSQGQECPVLQSGLLLTKEGFSKKQLLAVGSGA